MEEAGLREVIRRRWRNGAGAYVLHHASYPSGLVREVDYYIYALRDPRDNGVRYVGRTKNLKGRLQQHLYNKSDGSFVHARREWIQECAPRACAR